MEGSVLLHLLVLLRRKALLNSVFQPSPQSGILQQGVDGCSGNAYNGDVGRGERTPEPGASYCPLVLTFGAFRAAVATQG